MQTPVVAKLHNATAQALTDAKVREAFSRLCVEVVGSTPEEFAAFIKDDHARWAKVIKDAMSAASGASHLHCQVSFSDLLT